MQDVQIRNKYILSTRSLPTCQLTTSIGCLPLSFPTPFIANKKLNIFRLILFAVPARLVWAAPGKTVELPCDLTPPAPQDSVKLLLWFKDTTGIPLYR